MTEASESLKQIPASKIKMRGVDGRSLARPKVVGSCTVVVGGCNISLVTKRISHSIYSINQHIQALAVTTESAHLPQRAA